MSLVCPIALWLSPKHLSWESQAVIGVNISTSSSILFLHLVILYLFVLPLHRFTLPFNISVFEMKRQECLVTEVTVLWQQYPSVTGTRREGWLSAPLHSRNAWDCRFSMGKGKKKIQLRPPLHLTLTFVWHPDCIQIRLIPHSIYAWH